jgi:hypothetical protein
MPPICNAFLPGESVQVAGEQQLRSALALYRNGPTLLEELLPVVGKNFKILSCSFPHVAGVRYELSGLKNEVWQECLLDGAICEDDETRVRASAVYTARTITEAGRTLVVIEDNKHHIFAKFWRLHPENAVAEITEIASLRSRGAFEVRFWFDGDYERKRRD